MNRIYRLVWNRALRVMQVASELAHSPGGGNQGVVDARPLGRRHPLALACAAAIGLTLAAFALPARAQTCTPSPTQICGTNGGNGGNAGLGSSGYYGGAGGNSASGAKETLILLRCRSTHLSERV